MVKALVRRLLQNAGWDIHRLDPPTISARDRIRMYNDRGRVPWSTGYQETRDVFVQEALADETLLERFRRADTLPAGYGIGIDERTVEYPWAFARLPVGGGRILDAGGTLNYAFLVAHPLIRAKALHILTLVPEGHCQCVKGVSHIYADLRSVPMSSAYYDVIFCVSTLEHIGMDNTLFHGEVEDAPGDYVAAVREMRRLLRPGGILLLTVPFGTYKHFRSFQLFDQRLIGDVVAAFSPSHVEETYFRYAAQGWSLSNARACADAEYVPWIMQSPLERPNTFPVQPDRAAAARAVACLQLTA